MAKTKFSKYRNCPNLPIRDDEREPILDVLARKFNLKADALAATFKASAEVKAAKHKLHEALEADIGHMGVYKQLNIKSLLKVYQII